MSRTVFWTRTQGGRRWDGPTLAGSAQTQPYRLGLKAEIRVSFPPWDQGEAQGWGEFETAPAPAAFRQHGNTATEPLVPKKDLSTFPASRVRAGALGSLALASAQARRRTPGRLALENIGLPRAASASGSRLDSGFPDRALPTVR